ncbi:MAG: hypothetical protein HRT57_12830 [Crocinitomicaceae bacterium]|nr:hypothetical protein [Crocinitomicaceae bacterium]
MSGWAGLITFGLILLAAAMIVLLAFSCSLACNGSAALALLALFGGSFIIIFGFMCGLLFTYRKPSSERKKILKRALLVALIVSLVSVLFILLASYLG